MKQAIINATSVAGTLDILSAFVFAGIGGAPPSQVMEFVASGPFGDGTLTGFPAILAGMFVHYGIMACMAAAYIVIAPRIPALLRHPIVAGIAYGVLLWIIMYWIVRPLRWPDSPLPHGLWNIGNALFSHCILVGIPIAWIASRYYLKEPQSDV